MVVKYTCMLCRAQSLAHTFFPRNSLAEGARVCCQRTAAGGNEPCTFCAIAECVPVMLACLVDLPAVPCSFLSFKTRVIFTTISAWKAHTQALPRILRVYVQVCSKLLLHVRQWTRPVPFLHLNDCLHTNSCSQLQVNESGPKAFDYYEFLTSPLWVKECTVCSYSIHHNKWRSRAAVRCFN